jgi:uncharacterized protein YcaQ
MICSRIKHLERFLIDEPVATSSESALEPRAKAAASARALARSLTAMAGWLGLGRVTVAENGGLSNALALALEAVC